MNADSIVQPGDPILLNVPRELVGEHAAGRAADGPGCRNGRRHQPVARPPQTLDALGARRPTAESAEAVVRRMHADFVTRGATYASTSLPLPAMVGAAAAGGTGLHRIDWAVRKFEIGYWLRPELQGQGWPANACACSARWPSTPAGAARRDPLRRATRAAEPRWPSAAALSSKACCAAKSRPALDPNRKGARQGAAWTASRATFRVQRRGGCTRGSSGCNAPRRGPGGPTWPAAPRRPRSPAARRHRAWWRAPPVRSASRR